jgi:iron complex outermembrane receptor protein
MHQIALAGRQFAACANAKNQLFLGSAVIALLAGLTPGYAQDTTSGIETVVVSSSRITASGFSAPTPTTVVSSADIAQQAKPNVFDAITQLPSLTGSTGTTVNNGNTSTGANGLSQFNLRGLGTIRTLTLIDGQRIVPSYVTGTADVSLLPQMLLRRVDVVTGGASASWGSDAVGGVVNFVTDTKFNGIKANIQGGVSQYGDDTSGTVQLAGGTDLFGGRGHVEAAYEFYRNDGVAPKPSFSSNGYSTINGRCCTVGAGTLAYTTTTTPAGVPENTPIINSQSTSSSEYGLVTSGALQGMTFDSGSNFTPFQYGTNCVGTNCVGGDRTTQVGRTTVDEPITRNVFYTRLSYHLTPNMEIYGTFNLGNVWSANSPGLGTKTGLTLNCGANPNGADFYLPASVNAACVANKVTTLSVGVSYDAFPSPIRMQDLRRQRRYVLGTDGSFNMFGSDWTYDAYAEHGENDSSVHIQDMIITSHYNAASQAVAGPNGTVICAANANGANGAPGCVPFNVLGGAAISPQALAYVDPSTQYLEPSSSTTERQEAASIAINGTPFKDWAGDVALAFGAEYREEGYFTTGDPYGDGVTALNPYGGNYPADPQIATAGANYLAGNYHRGQGNYHVYEAFVETGVPLLDDATWGKANLDLAGRATGYSTSGYNQTWKVGTTWDTPLDGIRLRALQSRDVRAPNLSELFAATQSMNNTAINRLLPASAPAVNLLSNAIGNPNLKPETANTTELGIVYQPDYIAGFNLSVDYYRVSIDKQIGSLTNQQTVDLCQLYGNTSYCSFFNLNGTPGTNNPSYINLPPFNLAQTVTDGFDIESSYQFDLQNWGVPGNFVARALANHVSKYISNTGVIGQPIAEFAGASTAASGTTGYGGGVPLWKVYMTQGWSNELYSLTVTERFFSNGVVNPYAIVCQAPNCPVPTAQNPTYASDKVYGYTFFDIGGSYKITDTVQSYFKVDNLTNKLPNAIGGLNSDPIGRMYRIGIRFSE